MKLKIIDETLEAPETKTLILEPIDLSQISFNSGQFYIFIFMINGKQYKRCYSISCSEKDAQHRRISITIKKVQGGIVSAYVTDNSMINKEIEADGPAGAFTGDALLSKPVLLVAAGSGITPIYSIIKTWAESGDAEKQRVSLVYFNKSSTETIFYDALQGIDRGEDKFNLEFAFTRPEKGGSPKQTLSKDILERHLRILGSCHVATCGPASFMEDVVSLCSSLGIDSAEIFQESFTPYHNQYEESISGSRKLAVNFSCTEGIFYLDAGKTLLEAAEIAGARVNSLCGVGACAECKVKIISGQVEMNHQGGLTPRDENQGYILACCSKPLSDVIIETLVV